LVKWLMSKGRAMHVATFGFICQLETCLVGYQGH
jgi:hypothetical protein